MVTITMCCVFLPRTSTPWTFGGILMASEIGVSTGPGRFIQIENSDKPFVKGNLLVTMMLGRPIGSRDREHCEPQ